MEDSTTSSEDTSGCASPSPTAKASPQRLSNGSSSHHMRKSHHSSLGDEVSETDSGWSDVYRDDDDESLEDFDNESHPHNHHTLNLERIEEEDVVLHVKVKDNNGVHPEEGDDNNPATDAHKDDAYDSEDEFWNSGGDWEGNDTAATTTEELQLEHESNTLVLEHAQNTADSANMENASADKAPRRKSFPTNPPRRRSFLGQFLDKEHDKEQQEHQHKSHPSSSDEEDDEDDIASGVAVVSPASPSPSTRRSFSSPMSPDIKPLSPQERHDLSVPLGLDPDVDMEDDDEDDEDNNWDTDEEEEDGDWEGDDDDEEEEEEDDGGWDDDDDDDDEEEDEEDGVWEEGETEEKWDDEDNDNVPEEDAFTRQFVVSKMATEKETTDPITMAKVDGDEYNEEEETATAVTEDLTQSTPQQPPESQQQPPESEEQASSSPVRNLVAPRPPTPTEQRPERPKYCKQKKARTPEDWERLLATWERMELDRQKKQQQEGQPSNGSNGNGDQPTNQAINDSDNDNGNDKEEETSLHSFYPEDEKKLKPDAMTPEDANARQKKNGMGCFGDGVFPFSLLSSKKRKKGGNDTAPRLE